MIKSIEKVVTTYYYVELEDNNYPNCWRTSDGINWEQDIGMCWEYINPDKKVIQEFNNLLEQGKLEGWI